MLSGFAATLTEAQLGYVRKAPVVTGVEQNAQATVYEHSDRALGTTELWGLDRIDQRDLPLDKRFSTAGNGAGVKAYVMDTGIDFTYNEFGGRASTRSETAATARTARATAHTWRAPSAAARTGSPARHHWSACASWTARARATTPASSPESTGSRRTP